MHLSLGDLHSQTLSQTRLYRCYKSNDERNIKTSKFENFELNFIIFIIY